MLVCLLGTENIQDKKPTEAKRFAKVLAKIYLNGEKDGMVKLIGNIMEAFESQLSKGDMNAFQEFKESFEKLKNKGSKEHK